MFRNPDGRKDNTMNHQLYQDWLFETHDQSSEKDAESLTPQQEADLRAHLQSCQECGKLADSWREVEGQLRRTPEAAPEPGFTARWQARLEVDRLRLHRRQTLATLGFSVAGAFLLIGSLLVLGLPWLKAPSLLWWSWIYQLITMFTYADSVREALTALFRTTSGAVPLAGWVFFAGLLSELGVLWVVSYRLLTNPRRITQ
jgi:hypothetical protein